MFSNVFLMVPRQPNLFKPYFHTSQTPLDRYIISSRESRADQHSRAGHSSKPQKKTSKKCRAFQPCLDAPFKIQYFFPFSRTPISPHPTKPQQLSTPVPPTSPLLRLNPPKSPASSPAPPPVPLLSPSCNKPSNSALPSPGLLLSLLHLSLLQSHFQSLLQCSWLGFQAQLTAIVARQADFHLVKSVLFVGFFFSFFFWCKVSIERFHFSTVYCITHQSLLVL